jgi:hypothetical protein
MTLCNTRATPTKTIVIFAQNECRCPCEGCSGRKGAIGQGEGGGEEGIVGYWSDAARQCSDDRCLVPVVSGIGQAEKQTPRRRRDRDAVRAVGVGYDEITARHPARRCSEIVILLQIVAAGIWPGDNDAVAGMGNGQVGQTFRLRHGNQTPETAGHRITAAAHRAAGVVLAYGPTDGINAAAVRAAAGTAATGDFIPGNGIGLRVA